MLRACEHKTLKKRADGHKTPYQDRLRARIVLLAARSRSNAQIAHQLGITVDTEVKTSSLITTRLSIAADSVSGQVHPDVAPQGDIVVPIPQPPSTV